MDTVKFLNQLIAPYVGVRLTEGNVFGIELELEGRGVRLPDVATKGWTRHDDGSLRGESIEFTTAGGKTFEEAVKAVNDLFTKFKTHNVKFNDSVRTSTHVHLNFADKKLKDVLNFFMLFTVFEEVLQYYSGEDRKGNLFCISSREAEGIIHILEGAVAAGNMRNFAGDRYKYAACNLSTLFKFGTLEVRTMRGANSAEQVNRWLDILNDLYLYALNNMRSPVDLVVELSHLGAEGLLRKVFSPENHQEVMKTFPKAQNLQYSLMEGVRLIQVFAYEFDEDFRAPYEAPKKPEDLKKKEALPKIIQDGRFHGMSCAIYRANGMVWNLGGDRAGDFWENGEQVIDAANIYWDAIFERFVEELRDGRTFLCRWARHPWLEPEDPVIFEFDDDAEALVEADEDDFEDDEEEGDGW